MLRTTSGSTAIGRILGYHGDGLLDIFLGLVLLDAWAIVRGGPGASSGGAVMILFPLLLVAKRAITAPRLRLDWADPPPRSRVSGWPTLLAIAVAAFALVLLGSSTLPPSAHGGLGLPAWEIVALAGLGSVAAAGLHLGARRFVVYAVLTSVALVLTLQGLPGFATYVTPALAVGMIACGGVMLARFLAAGPRAA